MAQKLQSLYTKFRQAQNPGQSLDPLEFLPLELAEMVIENMEMRDRVYVCTLVYRPQLMIGDTGYASLSQSRGNAY